VLFVLLQHIEIVESEDDPKFPFATYVQPLKELTDVWEALAGEIFEDSGDFIDRTWEVIAPLLAPGRF
jgi:endoribonuclease Dicer